jgi:hypothetical protein
MTGKNPLLLSTNSSNKNTCIASYVTVEVIK